MDQLHEIPLSLCLFLMDPTSNKNFCLEASKLTFDPNNMPKAKISFERYIELVDTCRLIEILGDSQESAEEMDDDSLVSYIRIPKIVYALSGGGCLSTDDKITLGTLVKQAVDPNRKKKITIRVRSFDGDATLNILHYNANDLAKMWECCESWILLNKQKIAYPV